MFARMKSSRSGNLLMELLLIVVGINIALWFEGQFENLQERETEQQYLEGLLADLAVDKAELDQLIAKNQAKVERIAGIVSQLDNFSTLGPQEQAQMMFEPSSYLFFQASDFTFSSMRESGDFRLLRDTGTRELLLKLARQYQHIDTLQVNFIQAMDAEYIPLMMSHFDLARGVISDPALLENRVFLNFFPYTMEDTGQRLRAMEGARKLAAALAERVGKQLDG